MIRDKILILGKVPPPSGGVTIHVGRLLERLEDAGYPFDFYSLSNPVPKILGKALKYKTIHLHTSHVYFRFLFAGFSRLFGLRLVQTYHNNLGRFTRFKNFFEYASIRLTPVPIVINRNSYGKAKGMNKRTRLISSFIAPLHASPLPPAIQKGLDAWREDYETIFCTNASCLKYDIYEQEVYGGSILLEIFRELPGLGFVFSDPSGEYKTFLEEKYGDIPGNIFLIAEEHDFMEILKQSDCFIRSSTTDGDSLSVKEALWLQKGVIASDCVDRPKGCILYPVKDPAALDERIRNFKNEGKERPSSLDGFEDILTLYGSMRKDEG